MNFTMSFPRTLELFCCSGGMAEGFRRAGVGFDLAVDRDPDACDAYEQNLGHRPLQIDVRDLHRLCTHDRGALRRLELVVADPPCAPWSRAGKRLGVRDERDALIATASLLRLLRPHAWLVANIPGLDDACHVDALQKTLGALSPTYCIDYRALDAAAYGVPQHRLRPFWFGHSHGTPCLRWPSSTHGSCSQQLQLPGDQLLPYVTVRQALQHLHPDQLGRRVRIRMRRTRSGHPPSRAESPAGTITTGPAHNGGNLVTFGSVELSAALLQHDKHPINRADAPSYVITTKGDGRGAQGACVVEWPWDRPATAVHSDPRVATPGHHTTSRMSEPNAVKLSEVAAGILQGFPETWRFVGGTKAKRWAQIGQAVPPPMAAAIAGSVARWFQTVSHVPLPGPRERGREGFEAGAVRPKQRSAENLSLWAMAADQGGAP